MSHYFENDNNLKSEIKELSYKYDSSFFAFYSDNGVFSKNSIDYGSKLLLETYLKEAENDIRVLDVGCGYGYLGIVIGVFTNSYVDMIDVNKRAVHLAQKNIKRYPFRSSGNSFRGKNYPYRWSENQRRDDNTEEKIYRKCTTFSNGTYRCR
jgi:16S rRNA G1207 methylase RsmC